MKTIEAIGSARDSLTKLAARIPNRSRSAYLCSRLLYETIPGSLRSGIIASLGRSWPYFCPVCETRLPGFSPLPEMYFSELEAHGSDLKISDFETCNIDAYQCPHCGATDRDRLYALYLARRLPEDVVGQQKFKLLDIAPSSPLSRHISRNYKIQRRTADRFMKHVDDSVDVTEMSCYGDETFDAFICSHVLEHVEDDRKALKELWRILKPGGWGIAMVPINLALDEIREDASRTSPSERWKHFGQGDHVRVYSREGWVERLRGAGFQVQKLGKADFSAEQMKAWGLGETSVLYIAEKPLDEHRSAQFGESLFRSANANLLNSLTSHEDVTTAFARCNTPPLPAAPTPRSLAIAGGVPRFLEPVHVGRPNIGDKARLMKRIEEVLDRRWLTNNGPMVLEFEQRIQSLTGVKHCISMCNATVALEIAIRALDLKGEVIVPSYTFVATAHALQWQEITPVFADIDAESLNIDPKCIERLITPKTTGIIGVHVWGRPCDTESIQEIAQRRGLKVIYDAAHAFGCSQHGRMIGNFGNCEVLSFHATKFLNSFEGGAILTNDDVLAQKVRWMRNFGFADYDRVVYLGTNGKMSEVCAAMGLTSLEMMDEVIQQNRENYELYRSELDGLPGIKAITYSPEEKPNYHYVAIKVDPTRCPLTRDELVAVLHAENILARKYFWPGCHRMEPYKSLFPNASLLLPNTEMRAAQMMVLPTGQSMSREDVNGVCEIIKTALAQASELRLLLGMRSKNPA